MKTGTRTLERPRCHYPNITIWSRRSGLSWLITLLLFGGGAATAATVNVAVRIPSFDPPTVTIRPGDTVQWNWSDANIAHSVTSGPNGKSDGLFGTPPSTAPFTFSYTFPSPGTFEYFCIPHYLMGMVGFVQVVDSTDTPGTLGNISTRLLVETGDNALIGGFIVSGVQPKRVMIRAIGPSLSFAEPLADPVLELHGPTGFTTVINNNWKDTQEQQIIDTGIPPTNDLESAIVVTLPANNSAYTAIVRGVSDGIGVGLVEVYDLDRTVDSKLANISTRGRVQTGDDVLIAGTIVLGTASERVLLRAIGPSLSIPDKLTDPTLELRDAHGALLGSNDDWRSDQEVEINATTIPPTNNLESALVATLPSGGASYTAIVRGSNNGTGVALVEVYALN